MLFSQLFKFILLFVIFFHTVAAQAQIVISATNYGVKCDGVNDDSVGIKAAIDAAGRAGGGIVQLPATNGSPCVIKKEVWFQHDNIHLNGAGNGNTSGPVTEVYVNTFAYALPSDHPFLKLGLPYVSIAFNMPGADNFTASNIKFVGPRVWSKSGNDPSHDGKIFASYSTKNIKIEDVSFLGVGYAFLGGGTNGVTINRVSVIDWGRSALGSNRNTTITNSYFEQTGLDYTGKPSNKPAHDRWSEYAVYAYACNCNSSDDDGDSTRATYNFVFQNNIVKGARAGVHVNGGQQGYRPRYFTITNNTFENNRDSIIGSDFGGGGRWEDVVIRENKFIDDKRYSAYIYKGERIDISNNLFERTSEGPGGIVGAIKFISHFDDLDLKSISIAHNTINGANVQNWSAITLYEEGGYRLAFAPTKIYGLQIDNNLIYNIGEARYGAALYFVKSDRDRVRNVGVTCNTIAFGPNAGLTYPTGGIRVGAVEGSAPSSHLQEVVIQDNSFIGNGRANLFGIFTQNASTVEGRADRNLFDQIADSRKIVVTGNFTITDGLPSTACDPGIADGITPGAKTGVNNTPTPTPTRTNTSTPTFTPVVQATSTPTRTPTRTNTPTPKFTSVVQATPTRTPASTHTPTSTFTPVVQPTSTNTPTQTPTPTPTFTPTADSGSGLIYTVDITQPVSKKSVAISIKANRAFKATMQRRLTSLISGISETRTFAIFNRFSTSAKTDFNLNSDAVYHLSFTLVDSFGNSIQTGEYEVFGPCLRTCESAIASASVALDITNFKVKKISNNTFTVEWKTNKPVSTQLRYWKIDREAQCDTMKNAKVRRLRSGARMDHSERMRFNVSKKSFCLQAISKVSTTKSTSKNIEKI